MIEKLVSNEISKIYYQGIKNASNYRELKEIEERIITEYVIGKSKEKFRQEWDKQKGEQEKERLIFGSLLLISLVTISGLIIKLKTSKKRD